MKLSRKYKDFLRCKAPVEFLEGTTFAGKTTVGVIKFMFRVAESPKQLHVLTGLDLGTIEKNIINKELGIVDIFGDTVEYNASGRGNHSLPHIKFFTSKGIKIIYVLGYDNKTRWKKALGGQYGCVFIDEINVADMEYVREISMRCDYLIGTLNPDDPGLPIYSEYIDHSRPLKKWESETPEKLLSMLKQEPKPGWVHWFFSFTDNQGLTEEKMRQIMSMIPKGTKIYKNKILGLRGRNEGVIFSVTSKNIVPADWVRNEVEQGRIRWRVFSCGVDTSYSRKSDDKISFIFNGITTDGRKYRLDNNEYNNTERVANHLPSYSPSDVAVLLHQFLDRNRKLWGMPDAVYIDCADTATLTECEKYKRTHGTIYSFAGSFKKTAIIDRITLEQAWLAHNEEYKTGPYSFICSNCQPLLDEMDVYSWEEHKQKPEDANDHNINADQYAWLPYKKMIGIANERK